MKLFTKTYRVVKSHKPQKIQNLNGQTIAIIGKCGFVFYNRDEKCEQPCSYPDSCPFHKKELQAK